MIPIKDQLMDKLMMLQQVREKSSEMDLSATYDEIGKSMEILLSVDTKLLNEYIDEKNHICDLLDKELEEIDAYSKSGENIYIQQSRLIEGQSIAYWEARTLIERVFMKLINGMPNK